MATIRPDQLPSGTLTETAALIADTGSAVIKTTPGDIVNKVAPVASEVEAQQGIDNAKRMTALRVKQVVTAATTTIISPLYWTVLPGDFYKIWLSGVGTVTFDVNLKDGSVITGFTTVTANNDTEPNYTYFGVDAYAIKAYFTGTAIAEIR